MNKYKQTRCIIIYIYIPPDVLICWVKKEEDVKNISPPISLQNMLLHVSLLFLTTKTIDWIES